MAQRAYRRRRGWMAWHIARLVTNGMTGGGMPSLADLTGDARPDRAAQSGSAMLHNVRMLKAAMRAKKGNDG